MLHALLRRLGCQRVIFQKASQGTSSRRPILDCGFLSFVLAASYGYPREIRSITAASFERHNSTLRRGGLTLRFVVHNTLRHNWG